MNGTKQKVAIGGGILGTLLSVAAGIEAWGRIDAFIARRADEVAQHKELLEDIQMLKERTSAIEHLKMQVCDLTPGKRWRMGCVDDDDH